MRLRNEWKKFLAFITTCMLMILSLSVMAQDGNAGLMKSIQKFVVILVEVQTLGAIIGLIRAVKVFRNGMQVIMTQEKLLRPGLEVVYF